MAYLVSFGNNLQLKYPIKANRTTVGTNLTNDLVIISPLINEFHCEIILQNHKYYVVDHSKHGTYVLNNRVSYGQQVELQDKDKVLLTNPLITTQFGFCFYIGDENICKICLKQMKNPLVIDCGHIFCESCIILQEKTSNNCPLCGDEINEESDIEDESSCCSLSESISSRWFSENNCKNCLMLWKGHLCEPQSQHATCSTCGKMMPLLDLDEIQNAQKKLFCQLCFSYHCKYYYEDCRDPTQIELTRNLGKSLRIDYFNLADQERLIKHLNNKGIQNIFNDVSFLIEKGVFSFIHNKGYFQNTEIQFQKRILLDSVLQLIILQPVCFNCHQYLLIQIIMMYVELHKTDPCFSLPNCKYGIFCPYQQDKYHITQFNHICPQVEFD